jgi:multiple sugar transport system ATP-binding protein
MSSVTLSGVRKLYGIHEVIKGIDLAIEDREFVVFVGPSGCGKSTLLRMIAGLEDVDYGSVMIGARDVTELAPARRGVAMVFQNYALYPHMSAYDNLAYGLRRAGMTAAEVDRRVRDASAMLQITELLGRRPKAMSGGQRQRVAIGRAIVRQPEVFLFDEPLSNLDAALRVEMRTQIARLHHDLQATMIFVTHDQVEAMTLADRIVVLNGGRIEQVGTPRDVYHRPANLFVAGFIGSPAINLLKAEVLERDGPALRLRLAGEVECLLPGLWPGVRGGGRVTLGLRPERLRPDSGAGPLLSGLVTLAEHLGGETILHLDGPHGRLTVKTPGESPQGIGDRVEVAMDLAEAILFDEGGQRID